MSERRRERTRVSGDDGGSGGGGGGGGGSSRRRRRGGGGGGGGGGADGNRNRANQSGGRKDDKGGGSPKRGRKGGGRKRSQNRRGKNRRPDVLHDAARFWGDAGQLPAASQDVRITDDPAAVPRSLGPPPLPGHEAIAEQYFGVVYDRAVGTAGLLAAAGGLIDPDDLTFQH